MPRYSVGFHIHEVVFSSINVKTPIDPLVVVRCFDNEFVTSVKPSKTIVACWDEGYQWNNIELSQKSWNSGVIEFELQSANAFWRNDTLGTSALQLKLISACKNSTFSGEIPLTAPNSVSIIGYLTITVNAYDLSHESLRNAQPSVTKELELKQPTGLEVLDLTSSLVHRKPDPTEYSKPYKYFHLYINVYALEDIETEPFGFSPHITCEYAGCRLEFSKPIKVKGIDSGSEVRSGTGPQGESIDNKSSLDLISETISSYMTARTKLLDYNTEVRRSNYTFNQCFLIPIRVAVGEPTLEDNIILRIWKGYSVDLPLLSKSKSKAEAKPGVHSKLLAEGVFSLSRLRSSRQRPRWFNFYKTTESDFITNIISPSNGPELEDERWNSASVKSGINESYAGRVLLSASVKRINRVSDVLKAHVISSHQMEPLSPSPTRIFCDVFFIESSNDFTFAQGFEICLELSCGPYKTATSWQRVAFRKDMTDVLKRDIDFLGGRMKEFMNEEYFGSNVYSVGDFEGRRSMGWVCNFDSVQGRLNPMELLVAYRPEEQWFIFIRVLARKPGDKNVSILGSSKFTFDDLPSYQPNTVKVPIWLSLTTGEKHVPENIVTNTLNLISDLQGGVKDMQRMSSISTVDTLAHSSRDSAVGKMTANAAFLNVLVSLEKEMFYSSSLSAAANKQFRVASHSRRTALVLMDYELRVYVYSAKMDRIYENVSVSLTCDGRRKSSSSRRNRSLFPVFMECLSIPISTHTPVNNIVPNVPILVTLNSTSKEERYVYPGDNPEAYGRAPGKVVKKRVKVDVTEVLCSAVVTYNRLISSAKGHDRTGGVPRWLKIGNCKLLLFVDLVAKSEAKAVPKFQMLPQVHETSVKLGLLGLRNLIYSPDWLAQSAATPDENLVIRTSMQNYGICTEDEQYYEFLCKSEFATTWVSNGKRNYDLFSVHAVDFKTPAAPLFDPFVEIKVMRERSKSILGYCCLPLYENNRALEKYSYMDDLRACLVPARMLAVFESLQKLSVKGSYELSDVARSSTESVDNGLAEVFQQFHQTPEFRRMVRSLEFENTSFSVPPRILVVADGKKVEHSSSLSYNLVSDTNIDDILADVPYNTRYLFFSGGSGEAQGAAGASRELAAGRSCNNDEVEMGSLKYFLTISDRRGYKYCSYSSRYADIAVESNKMFRVFRGGLKSSLFKIRLCVISSSSFPCREANSTTYLAVDIASRENREALVNKDGLTSNINKSYERDIFLPEHSLVVLKAIESYTTITGDTVERLIATGQIDLENRWFSKTWQSMQRNDNVPIERIVLYDKGRVQGHVNLLLQLAKIDKFPLLKTINLTQAPTSSVEIRVIIWSIRDAKIPHSEAKKDMLDLFVCSRLDCHTYSGSYQTEQKTDIHYNCDSGNASFNWRVVYPEVKTPVGSCHLQLQVYDFWKIGSPIFLGDVNLELRSYIGSVSTTGNMVRVDGELPIYPNAKTTPSGLIHITLQVLTQSEANTRNVGLGRDEPNRDPYLIVPNAGRQWDDWLAHTGLSIDFSGYNLYFRIVGCFLMLVWLVIISFIYPAILL